MKNPTPMDMLRDMWSIISPLHKEILRYLVAVKKKCGQAFPSLARIAAKVYCSVSTVKRAINFFENMGILAHKKRAYNSNLYFLISDLLKVNLRDGNWHLFKPNEPVREPVSYDPNLKRNIYRKNISAEAENRLKYPPYAESLLNAGFMCAFDHENYGHFIRNASEYAIKSVLAALAWAKTQYKKHRFTEEELCRLVVATLRKSRF